MCDPTCDLFDPKANCPQDTACTDLVVETFTQKVFPICASYGARGEGEGCTRPPGSIDGHDCQIGLDCLGDGTSAPQICMRFCDTTHACPKSGQTCTGLMNGSATSSYSVCMPAMGACQPNPCTAAHRSVCTVQNGAAQCACDSGYAEVNGACVSTCTPACAGKTCGSDGCGGSCGACGSGTVCGASGTCQAVCQPSCAGKACGPDGCGGSCGSCGFGSTCNAGQCSTCQPSCAGRSCGPDGCGGSCGSCSAGTTCSSGTCVSSSTGCDPVANTGCTIPNGCWVLSSGQTTCALTGSGTQGSACATTSNCSGGYACFAGTCRKICDVVGGTGCSLGSNCTGVSGWTQYGACR
jgi:hypothetical protein